MRGHRTGCAHLRLDVILLIQCAERKTAKDPQNLHRAKAMVASGSVFYLSKVKGRGCAVEGYVAAEKTSNKFYRAAIDVIGARHLGAGIAQQNTHRCCKPGLLAIGSSVDQG